MVERYAKNGVSFNGLLDNAPAIWLANYNINMGEAYETKMYKCVGYNRDDLECAGNDYELDYLLWTAGQICSICSIFWCGCKHRTNL